eukprot:8393874-Pyramimonas_sp.AAC.1
MQKSSAEAQPPSEQSSEEVAHGPMLEMHRRADHRGSDARLDIGLPYWCNAWPRVSVDQRRWCWKRAAAA